MSFAFDAPALHNFLWRTRLDRREVSKNLFSISFGVLKVVMETSFFLDHDEKHLFLNMFSRFFNFGGGFQLF